MHILLEGNVVLLRLVTLGESVLTNRQQD